MRFHPHLFKIPWFTWILGLKSRNMQKTTKVLCKYMYRWAMLIRGWQIKLLINSITMSIWFNYRRIHFKKCWFRQHKINDQIHDHWWTDVIMIVGSIYSSIPLRRRLLRYVHTKEWKFRSFLEKNNTLKMKCYP